MARNARRHYRRGKADRRGATDLRPSAIFAKQSVGQNFSLSTVPPASLSSLLSPDRTDYFPRAWRSMRAHVRVYEDVPFEGWNTSRSPSCLYVSEQTVALSDPRNGRC